MDSAGQATPQKYSDLGWPDSAFSDGGQFPLWRVASCPWGLCNGSFSNTAPRSPEALGLQEAPDGVGARLVHG